MEKEFFKRSTLPLSNAIGSSGRPLLSAKSDVQHYVVLRRKSLRSICIDMCNAIRLRDAGNKSAVGLL